MVQSSWASFLVMVVVAPLLLSASMVRDSTDEEQQLRRVPASMRHRLSSVVRPSVNQGNEVNGIIEDPDQCYHCKSYFAISNFPKDDNCGADGYTNDNNLIGQDLDSCCFINVKANGHVKRGSGCGVNTVDTCLIDGDGTTCYCTGDKCNSNLCQQCPGSSSTTVISTTDISSTDIASTPSTSENPTDDPVSTNSPTEPPSTSVNPTDEPISTNSPTEPPSTSVNPTDEPISTNSPTEPPSTTHPGPSSEEELLVETKATLETIKASYDTLLNLTQSLIPTDAPATTEPVPSSTSNYLANVARDVTFDIRATGDGECSSQICSNITLTMADIKKTTKNVKTWTLEANKLPTLNEESITLQEQVIEADAHKDDDDFKNDAGFINSQVNEDIKDLDDTIKDVDDKIKENEDQNTNSIILVSVIGGVGGLIVIALLGTSIYACISKGKKDKKVGLDGPAADISMEELDKPETQEPRNAPARDAPNESQPLNPYTMNPLREQATDMRRSPSTRDPYAAQPARTPPSDIERSAGTRGAYSDQPQRYPPRNLERSTSSRDPNIPSEPRGLNRNQDPFVHQSPKKQAPVVPKKPQGYSRQNSYNGQQQSSRSRLESSDSNGYGIPRATPDPRVPRGRAGPPHDDRPRGAGPHDDRPRGAGPHDDRPRGAGPHDDRPRGAGPSRDPYSQPPHRGGSRPANNSNYY